MRMLAWEEPAQRGETRPALEGAMFAVQEPRRCGWAATPLSIRYHDEEWGVPVHDDHSFFAFLG